MWFVILLPVLALLLMTGCNAILPRTVGSPFGLSVRAGRYIGTLIATQEPYLPSLHRNPENDRFRMDLLLHSADGRTKRPLIPLASSLRHSEFRNSAKILGSDGALVWFIVKDIGAYNLETGRVLTVDHLRRANPHLDELWQNARYSFGRRLQVISHDYKHEFEIDPETLRAIPAKVSRRVAYSPSETGQLVTSRKDRSLNSTYFVSLVDTTGKTLWTTNTGIADLDQTLPDRDFTAFIGKRPRVEGKVQEPILAIVNNATGVLTIHSLWQR